MAVLVLGDLHLDQWLEQGRNPFSSQGACSKSHLFPAAWRATI